MDEMDIKAYKAAVSTINEQSQILANAARTQNNDGLVNILTEICNELQEMRGNFTDDIRSTRWAINDVDESSREIESRQINGIRVREISIG